MVRLGSNLAPVEIVDKAGIGAENGQAFVFAKSSSSQIRSDDAEGTLWMWRSVSIRRIVYV